MWQIHSRTRASCRWHSHGAMIVVAGCLVMVAGCSTNNSDPAQLAKDHVHEDDHDHDSSAHHHDHDHGHAHDHEHGEAVAMPADYRAAVAQLHACRDRVASALKSQQLDAAHDSLDAVDEWIDKFMGLVQQSGLPRGDWEEANSARRALQAQFGMLQTAIHEGTPVVAASTLAAIDAELARLDVLRSKLPQTAVRDAAQPETPTSQIEGSP